VARGAGTGELVGVDTGWA
jgi:hypothetical protein